MDALAGARVRGRALAAGYRRAKPRPAGRRLEGDVHQPGASGVCCVASMIKVGQQPCEQDSHKCSGSDPEAGHLDLVHVRGSASVGVGIVESDAPEPEGGCKAADHQEAAGARSDYVGTLPGCGSHPADSNYRENEEQHDEGGDGGHEADHGQVFASHGNRVGAAARWSREFGRSSTAAWDARGKVATGQELLRCCGDVAGRPWCRIRVRLVPSWAQRL